MKVFTTTVSANKYFESICNKAVENACYRLLGTLQELIESEYYDLYEPNFYKRTYQFLESVTVKMLNKTCAKIFMDETTMNYGEYWDGETQLYMADAGYHGTTDIYTNGHFWKSFIEYCEDNAVNILVDEMQKQGLNIINTN